MATEAPPKPFGRYELLERLAVGGMAELFKARMSGEHGFERIIVIKRILPQLAADEHFTKMFINEAKITAKLNHPKIAQTYELGREGDRLFIAMEYVDGLDALALLREIAHHKQQLPNDLCVFIMQEVADALDFAHKLSGDDGEPLGIVHRDVSPSNILMSTRGDVKLVDFGIAQAVQQEHHTKSGTLKGKYGYMSPEQIVGGKVTWKSDIFAAGVVLAEMLMGKRLFAAPNELDVLLMVRDVHLGRLEKYGVDIPAELMSIVLRCLRKDPFERYGDAAELRDALADWMFNQRKRIGSTDVAGYVSRYLDQARFRQAELLRQVDAEGDDGDTTGDVKSSQAPASAETQGSFKKQLSPSSAEAIDAAVAAVEPADDISIPVHASAEEPAAETKPTPAPAAAEEAAFFDLGDLSDVDLASASQRDGGEDANPAELELLPEDASTQPSAEPAAVAPPKEDQSAGRDKRSSAEMRAQAGGSSIEDAVASLALPDLDPSATDFDDAEITEYPKRSIKMKMRETPPSQVELDKAPKAPAPRLRRISGEATENGTFDEYASIRVLYERMASESTGLLVVEAGSIKKEIYLVDGKPEFVASNVASELLGTYLVNEGVVTAGELDMALAMMPHYEGKLGDTLVGLGLVRPLDVFRHLTRQVRLKLVDVCTWQRGTFQWYPDRKYDGDAFPLDIDPFEVLGAGALDLTPMILQGWIENHKHDVPMLTGVEVEYERFGIEELESAKERLDGSPLMSLLAAIRDPRDRGRFVRCLYLLLAVSVAAFESGR